VDDGVYHLGGVYSYGRQQCVSELSAEVLGSDVTVPVLRPRMTDYYANMTKNMDETRVFGVLTQ